MVKWTSNRGSSQNMPDHMLLAPKSPKINRLRRSKTLRRWSKRRKGWLMNSPNSSSLSSPSLKPSRWASFWRNYIRDSCTLSYYWTSPKKTSLSTKLWLYLKEKVATILSRKPASQVLDAGSWRDFDPFGGRQWTMRGSAEDTGRLAEAQCQTVL